MSFKGNYTKYQSAGICLFDDRKWALGTGTWATSGENGAPDVDMYWDGSNGRMQITPAVDNTKLYFGTGSLGMDLRIYGSTGANYVEHDASENTLTFTNITPIGVPFMMVFTQPEALTVAADIDWSFIAPHAMTITEVSTAAQAVTAAIKVDVKEGTTSILTTSVAVTTTATATAPSDGGIANNAIVHVTAVTDTTGTATDLCVCLTGQYA